MNEKIQAILLKIVIDLKKLGWITSPDWQITLKSEGHIPLVKSIDVTGNMDDDEWTDQVETTIDLSLGSDDEITYFPAYTIYATIYMKGGEGHDIASTLDADVAFTAHDLKDDKKASLSAKKISNIVEEHIATEYSDYIDKNAASIKAYKQGGWRADQDF